MIETEDSTENKSNTTHPVLIPELISLIGCINEYYSLKDSMSNKFMKDIDDVNEVLGEEEKENDLMVPKEVDAAIKNAFINQLKRFS